MDSRPETYVHILKVQANLNRIVEGLINRGQEHDQTKLHPPEVEYFDQHTANLKNCKYPSPEYTESLKAIKPALDHHYAKNRHHPQHFPDGVGGMNLLDLVEMFCDWDAATQRQNEGNIRRSIQENQQRFGFSDDLKQIFLNSIDLLK